MILNLLTWSPDKQTLIDGLIAYNFASVVKDRLGRDVVRLHPEVRVSHIGKIAKPTGNIDPVTGRPTYTIIGGHHANLRCFGSLAEWFVEGKDQYDNETGKLKPLFERTRLLDVIEGLVYNPTPAPGVAAGYTGPIGVTLIDPATVTTPYRVWV